MRETQRHVYEAIRAGKDTNEKIRQEMGWDIEKGRKKLHYHKEKLKTKGLIEETKPGHYRALIGPDRIADPKRLKEIIDRIKNSSGSVRNEAFQDLRIYAMNWTIIDKAHWEFLFGALKNLDYEDNRPTILICIESIRNNLRGTKFEIEIKKLIEKDPSFLVNIALYTETRDPGTRKKAIESLIDINEAVYFDTILKVLNNRSDPHFRNIDVLGGFDSSNAVGVGIYNTVSHLSKEKLEKLRDELYRILEENQDLEKNKDTEASNENCKILLDKLREKLYSHNT